MVQATRSESVLLGLAVGDAFGLPVEFESAEEVVDEYGWLDELIGYESWNQPVARVSDDTDMTMCLARSLVQQGRFDAQDVADRFVRWFRNRPVGNGRLTKDVITQLDEDGDWRSASRTVWERRSEGQNAGNGGLMRAAPIALAYTSDPDAIVKASRLQSAITHWDHRCRDSSAALNLVIAALLEDDPEPVETALDEAPSDLHDDVVAALRRVANGSPELENSAYAIHTLESGLWYGLTESSTRATIEASVNELGGDTDTIAAVAGAVAGAKHGAGSIPDDWVFDRRACDHNAINSKQWGNIDEELRTLGVALSRMDIEPPE